MPTVARCTPSLHANTSAASSSTESKWLTTRSNCRSLGAARAATGARRYEAAEPVFPSAAKTSAAEASARGSGIPPLRFASCSICASSTSRTEGAVRRAVPRRVPSTRTNPAAPPPASSAAAAADAKTSLFNLASRRSSSNEFFVAVAAFMRVSSRDAFFVTASRSSAAFSATTTGSPPTYTSGSSARNTQTISRCPDLRSPFTTARAPSTSQAPTPYTGSRSLHRRKFHVPSYMGAPRMERTWQLSALAASSSASRGRRHGDGHSSAISAVGGSFVANQCAIHAYGSLGCATYSSPNASTSPGITRVSNRYSFGTRPGNGPLGNRNAFSRAASLTVALACATLRSASTPSCARMDFGCSSRATSGSVGPTRSRHARTASTLESTATTTGPLARNSAAGRNAFVPSRCW